MSRKPHSPRDIKRPPPKHNSRDRVLIICEGSKTEPNYFEELRDHLKLDTAKVEVDGSSGSSPKSVVEYAKRRYLQDNEYERIYCVFDQDSHATYGQALNTLNAQQPAGVFHAITSVPCFEYWLLLHFTFTTKPYAHSGTRSPADCVMDDLKQYIPAYDKGNRQIYAKLRDKTELAIKYAERASQQAIQIQTDNPTTEVYKLVTYLRMLKNS